MNFHTEIVALFLFVLMFFFQITIEESSNPLIPRTPALDYQKNPTKINELYLPGPGGFVFVVPAWGAALQTYLPSSWEAPQSLSLFVPFPWWWLIQIHLIQSGQFLSLNWRAGIIWHQILRAVRYTYKQAKHLQYIKSECTLTGNSLLNFDQLCWYFRQLHFQTFLPTCSRYNSFWASI